MSALDMIDDVIDTIRRSKDKATARTNLMKRDFTERQATRYSRHASQSAHET